MKFVLGLTALFTTTGVRAGDDVVYYLRSADHSFRVGDVLSPVLGGAGGYGVQVIVLSWGRGIGGVYDGPYCVYRVKPVRGHAAVARLFNAGVPSPEWRLMFSATTKAI